MDFHSPSTVISNPHDRTWAPPSGRRSDASPKSSWPWLDAPRAHRAAESSAVSVACAPLIGQGIVALIRNATFAPLPNGSAKLPVVPRRSAGVEKIDASVAFISSAPGFAVVGLLLFAPNPSTTAFILLRPEVFPVGAIPASSRPNSPHLGAGPVGRYLIYSYYPQRGSYRRA